MGQFGLQVQGKTICLPKPCVMGVINMSPDSFYRPYQTNDQILKTIEAMVKAGASIVDIGGEATNPFVNLAHQAFSRDGGSQGGESRFSPLIPSIGFPDAQDIIKPQLERILPMIEKICAEFDILVSVDTSYPLVMLEAVKAGAKMINDQRGLQLPGALEAVKKLNVPVCLMHFFLQKREPGSSTPAQLLTKIIEDLHTAAQRCLQAGVSVEQILVDPGFGQGHYCKNVQENFYILAHLQAIIQLGFPVLVGWSRKSMLGDILNAPPAGRLYGSIAAATLAAMNGAAVLRVHDVAETMDAVRVVNAYKCELN